MRRRDALARVEALEAQAGRRRDAEEAARPRIGPDTTAEEIAYLAMELDRAGFIRYDPDAGRYSDGWPPWPGVTPVPDGPRVFAAVGAAAADIAVVLALLNADLAAGRPVALFTADELARLAELDALGLLGDSEPRINMPAYLTIGATEAGARLGWPYTAADIELVQRAPAATYAEFRTWIARVHHALP